MLLIVLRWSVMECGEEKACNLDSDRRRGVLRARTITRSARHFVAGLETTQQPFL